MTSDDRRQRQTPYLIIVRFIALASHSYTPSLHTRFPPPSIPPSCAPHWRQCRNLCAITNQREIRWHGHRKLMNGQWSANGAAHTHHQLILQETHEIRLLIRNILSNPVVSFLGGLWWALTSDIDKTLDNCFGIYYKTFWPSVTKHEMSKSVVPRF